MPHYFFDIDDGNGPPRIDDEGYQLSGIEAAREEAIVVLHELARFQIPVGDRHDCRSTVRDESGRVVFWANLSLTTGWFED